MVKHYCHGVLNYQTVFKPYYSKIPLKKNWETLTKLRPTIFNPLSYKHFECRNILRFIPDEPCCGRISRIIRRKFRDSLGHRDVNFPIFHGYRYRGLLFV